MPPCSDNDYSRDARENLCCLTLSGVACVRCKQLANVLCRHRSACDVVGIKSVTCNYVTCRDECSKELCSNHYHGQRVPASNFRRTEHVMKRHWGVDVFSGSGNKVSTPGVEPGLSRPRRDVLTTRRYGPCISCISLASWISIQVCIACCYKLNLVASLS